MNLEHFILPEHWASALVNGDDSGMDPEDIAHIEAWSESTGFETLNCVDVQFNDSGDFRTYHDAKHVGVLACNVAQYTFDVGIVK